MMTVAIRFCLAFFFVVGGIFSTHADPADLVKAGVEAIDKSRWEEAIRVLSQAIAAQGLSDQDRATAHVNRGYVYLAQGQAGKAIVDYTAAIRLAPKEADAHSLRGWAHFTEGKMKQAIADSTAALRLDPTLAFAFSNRGRAQLYAGQARLAVDDFAAAVRLAPSDVLGVIWLHIARARAGQADQQEFTANLAKIDRRTWPGPIADVLSGAITQGQLGDIAMSAAGEKPQPERVCEARMYLGLLQLAVGDKDEARKLFQAAVEECPVGVAEATERAVAKMELKRLGAAPARAAPKSTAQSLESAKPRSDASTESPRIGEQIPPSPMPSPSYPNADSILMVGTIALNSDPPDARVTTSLGSGCQTPCSMEVSAAEPFTVTFTHPGYAPSTVDIRMESAKPGLSDQKLSPNPVFVQLVPAKKVTPKPDKPAPKPQ